MIQAAPSGGAWRFAIFDATGRLVRELRRGSGETPSRLAWDGRDNSGARVATGIYWVRGEVGGHTVARRCVLLGP